MSTERFCVGERKYSHRKYCGNSVHLQYNQRRAQTGVCKGFLNEVWNSCSVHEHDKRASENLFTSFQFLVPTISLIILDYLLQKGKRVQR